jgi:hypothetical protein
MKGRGRCEKSRKLKRRGNDERYRGLKQEGTEESKIKGQERKG